MHDFSNLFFQDARCVEWTPLAAWAMRQVLK